MRKILLSISLVLLATLATTACKKEYTCTYIIYYDFGNMLWTDTSTFDDTYFSKSRANSECQDMSDPYSLSGATAVDCQSAVK